MCVKKFFPMLGLLLLFFLFVALCVFVAFVLDQTAQFYSVVKAVCLLAATLVGLVAGWRLMDCLLSHQNKPSDKSID